MLEHEWIYRCHNPPWILDQVTNSMLIQELSVSARALHPGTNLISDDCITPNTHTMIPLSSWELRWLFPQLHIVDGHNQTSTCEKQSYKEQSCTPYYWNQTMALGRIFNHKKSTLLLRGILLLLLLLFCFCFFLNLHWLFSNYDPLD